MKRIKNILQKLLGNEKVRIGVISYFVYLTFALICGYILFLPNPLVSSPIQMNMSFCIKELAAWLLLSIIYPVFLIIPFSPIFVVKYFLWKKLENPKLKTIILCLMFPLVSCLFYIIEHYCMMYENYLSIFINAYILILIFPAIFLVYLFVPNRKRNLSVIVFTWIIWVGLFKVTGFLVDNLDLYLDIKALNKCETIINNIEKYKEANGNYPSDIKETLPTKRFRNYSYVLEKNNKDYIFTLNNKIYEEYLYCSNKNAEYCKIERTLRHKTEQFGKWVKYTEFD